MKKIYIVHPPLNIDFYKSGMNNNDLLNYSNQTADSTVSFIICYTESGSKWKKE